MKRLCINITLAILALTFTSCATMFNSQMTNLTIFTSQPSKLVLNGDTLIYLMTNRLITVDRDSKPVILTAYNDSATKTIHIKAINSFAYWLNLYPNVHLWTGFRIDTKTKKRYTYPKTVFMDLTKNDSTYLTYRPHDEFYNKYSNILKITPLKLIGLVNPGFELSYERRTGNSFSTQIMGSYLLPMSVWNIGNDFKPNIKGFRLAIEEKFYFMKTAPMGPYCSFEFNYLKNQYKDILNFGTKDIYSDSTYNFTNYEDTYGINKQTFTFNLKLGYQLIVKRLSFDFYAGLGFKYKNVVHFDRDNPNDEMESPIEPNIDYITNFEGKYWTVSIPLNFRIGWAF